MIALQNQISNWIANYANKYNISSLVIGISGGVDSAVTSTLCAMTGIKTKLLIMPIHQNVKETSRGVNHCSFLKKKFSNVEVVKINLTDVYEIMQSKIPSLYHNHLSLANTRARVRMTALYAIAGGSNGIVVGTGNKVEDFGVGFYTKYGDGGVDISPIADCNKTEVWELGKELGILKEIIDAPPTDGLWDDGRTDEGQLGFKYQDLEDAMVNSDSPHKAEYEKIRKQNMHKMEPIPVCKIPS